MMIFKDVVLYVAGRRPIIFPSSSFFLLLLLLIQHATLLSILSTLL